MAKFVELKQRHIEGWVTAISKERSDDWQSLGHLPAAVYDGVAVRAAVAAGWFEDVVIPDGQTAGDVVGEMTFAEVAELSPQIWEAYHKATRVDPN